MNANNRLMPRHRRRLKITLTGCAAVFSLDLSAGGFSAEMMKIPRRGSTVQGTLELDGHTFPFTGEVRWTQEPDARVQQRGRLGVRFTGISNDFYTAFDANTRSKPAAPAKGSVAG